MAYRTADQERWKDFDFVVGQRVCLSPTNHPVADICDELKGEYPKDFKFVGWHPHCRCYVESILKSDKELKEDTRRIIRGEQPTDDSTNAVTATPPNFDAWVKDNRWRIEHAKTPPYFIRDNRTRIDDILNGSQKAQPAAKRIKTPQEVAVERHARRDAEKIQKAWEQRRQQIEELRNNAQSVSGELDKYALDDTDGLVLRKIYQDAIAGNDLNAMHRNMAAAKEYLRKQAEMRTWLGDTIPDIEKWNEKLTLSQLAEVRGEIKLKMQGWEKKTPEQRQVLINKEIGKILKDKNNPLRDVANAAWGQQYYKQSLLISKNQLPAFEAFASKHAESKLFQVWLAKLKDAINRGNGQAAAAHANGLNFIKAQFEKTKKTATPTPTSTSPAKTKPATKATTLPDWAKNPQTGQAFNWATEAQIKKTMTECGCSRVQALRMNRAVRNFSAGWDSDIRCYQQGLADSVLVHDVKEVKQRAADLEKFINAAPQWNGGTTFRGIAVDPATFSQFKRRAKDGGAIGMLGTSSWSTERSVSMQFGLDVAENIDDAVVCLFRCEGKQKGVSIRHLSAYIQEEEVACSQSARWRIKSARNITTDEDYPVWEFIVELIE